MKILIIGSSGHLGSCLFERLSGGHEVFGLDLRQGPYANVVGDIRDFGLVSARFGNIVLHLIALYPL